MGSGVFIPGHITGVLFYISFNYLDGQKEVVTVAAISIAKRGKMSLNKGRNLCNPCKHCDFNKNEYRKNVGNA